MYSVPHAYHSKCQSAAEPSGNKMQFWVVRTRHRPINRTFYSLRVCWMTDDGRWEMEYSEATRCYPAALALAGIPLPSTRVTQKAQSHNSNPTPSKEGEKLLCVGAASEHVPVVQPMQSSSGNRISRSRLFFVTGVPGHSTI